MKKILVILFVLIGINGLSQNKILLSNYIDSISNKLNFTIIKNTHYTNLFNKKENVPLLIWYTLNPLKYKLFNNDSIENKLNKNKVFFEDKRLNYSLVKYYKNTGFDRGHFFNAEDASFDFVAFESSYLITNSAPQNIQFNRGIWKKLESYVRKESSKNELIIITGSDLFNEKLLKIGIISVPNYFYKIVINLTKQTINIYYIPNKLCYDNFFDYQINKKDFAEKTGIYLK